MRKLTICMFFSLMAMISVVTPITSQAAPTEPAQIEEAIPQTNHRLLAVGAGAIIGIVTFNMLTYPLGSVPFVAAPLDPTPVEIALGSRVLATLTAGATALIAHYLYEPEGAPQ